jgi:lambda repressor-like predicted transcriptional regulator
MGKKKITIAERARRAGLPATAVRQRLHKYGWSLHRALAEPLAKDKSSISKRARAAGLRPDTVYGRLNRGWPETLAFTRPAHRGVGVRLTIGAQATAAGLEPKTVYKRLRRGWGLARALSEPYQPLVAHSANPTAIRHRIYIETCVQQASALVGKRLSRPKAMGLLRDLRVALMGATLSRRAREAGLNKHTVYARIHHGWSEEQALTAPVRSLSRLRHGSRDLVASLTAKAREAGLSPKTVWDRVRRRGWSEERALGTPPLQ